MMNWSVGLTVLVLVGLIILFEKNRLMGLKKVEKIIFVSILIVSVGLSFFNLEKVPGPTTLLHYIFGSLGKFMQ